MSDQPSSMDLDENRASKPLARSRVSASAISAEGGQGIGPPDPDDPAWPNLPATPEKLPTNRQRLAHPGAGQNALQLEMQEELSALNDNGLPKPPPKARRSIGISSDESELETDATPKAVPKGGLQVRSRRLQRTRSGPSGADFTHSILMKHRPIARQPRPPPLPTCRGMLLLVTLALVVRQPPDLTPRPPHASGPWELMWPNGGQKESAHNNSPPRPAAPPPRKPGHQPSSHVPHVLTMHHHVDRPKVPSPDL